MNFFHLSARLFAALILVLWTGLAARAHEAIESTTVARLQHGRLEVVVTMSLQVAARLAGDSGEVESAVAGSQERLGERAARLWEVFAGETRLRAERVTLRRNREGEPECVLIYPAPTGGPLRFRAGAVEELPAGALRRVEVFDEQEMSLGQRSLLGKAAGAELIASAEAQARTAAAPEPVAVFTPPPVATRHPGPALGILAAVGWVAILLLRRGRRGRWAKAVLLLALALSPLPLHAQRQVEKLGRGVIAVRSNSTQVYVGWRLLGNDPEDVAFNLYRLPTGGALVKINTANGGAALSGTTDFVDTPGNLNTTEYTYSVRPVVGGVEVPDVWAHPQSAGYVLPLNAPTRQYVSVPLQATPDGPLDVKFCWVGDLDGNGEFDFVVDRQSADGFRQFLEAYTRAGALLWRMDMGPNSTNHYNIEPGSSAIGIGHGDMVTVYDMDGDGLAEVIVRTANGVVFGNGATVTRGASSNVQFLSIVNGQTGAEMAWATIPNPILSDGPMNGHMGIFFPDGQRPSVLLEAKNRAADESFHGAVTVWDWRGGVLSQRWTWTNLGALHAPEGHQIRFGDVDNDGRDEFIDIGYVLDDNGTQLFNIPEVVHGDRFHMTDIDPDRPGLETFIIQQNNGTGLATAFFDAATGGIIRKWYAGGVVDVGRGVVADMDPASKGCEFFSTQANIYDAKGNAIYGSRPFPPEAIWWDADLSREFVATVGSTAESPAISKFNPADPANFSRIYTIYNETAPGVYQAYGGRPQFWGDLFGDWREEYLCVANDNSELRIYTAKTPSITRLYTLMHNPQYRCQTTTKGYVQASYVDYFLGTGMTPPPPPPIVEAQLTWRGGAGATVWDAGITSSWKSNAANSTYSNGQTVRFDIGADSSTGVALTGNLQPGAVTVYSPKNHTFDGTGGALGGAMKLTKAGAGTLTISGNHGFTGKTVVWDGALVMNGDLQGSAVTVWGGIWGGALSAGLKGGRIGGSGRFLQPVAVKYRGAITPGAGMGSAGTVTFGAGLTADDGSTFALDLSDDPTGTVKANDRIAVTGNLVLGGKVAIVLKPLNTQLAAGTYTLLTYTGALTGSVSNLAVTVPAGTPYTLAAGAGVITLTVPTTRAPAPVTWRGSGGAWDLATSQNWLVGGMPDVFVAGDAVTFDATGALADTATLSTALPTAGVTVNAATNYTLSGAGSLTGAGGLTKTGAGTLTISTTNDYLGATTVNGGVLAIAALGDAGAPSSIGASGANASNFVLNGGTLRLTGPQTNTNRNLTLGAGGGVLDIATAGSSMQISGAIGGSGLLTKTGPGTLLLANANSFAGGTVINGGTVYLAGSNANANALGAGAVTINSGTLTMADVQNNDVADWDLVVPVGATARLNADGRCSLTGSLSGGGAFTLYTGYVRTDLKGNWSAFTGQIFAVSDADGGDFRITNTAGFPNAALDLGDQVYAYYNTNPPSGGQAIDIGALSGVATASLKGGPTSGRTVTYRIGGKNLASAFAGTIANSTGATALTKLGTAALTLAGDCTYTGATTVSAGALLVTGSLTGSNVTVQNGATLGGSGSITGNVTVNTGGRLAFTASGGAITGLTITGNLALAGTITITPAIGSGAFASGIYTIATYSGTLTGSYSLAWLPPLGSTQSATFDTSTPGVVKMTVTSTAPVLTWTGAVSSAWDTATANWQSSGASAVFAGANPVVFGDSPVAAAVALAGPLSPDSVTFANATTNYAFTTTGGGLASAAPISKSGAGKVTFYGANGHSGTTSISGGILALGDDGSTNAATVQNPGLTGGTTTSLGTGGVLVQSGGQLRFGGRGNSTVYTFTTANPITLNGGTLVSYDGLQKLTGGITVGASGANITTAWNQKNLYLNGTLNGAGPIVLDDLAVAGETSSARFRIDTANNSYSGTLTINGPSVGFHGGRLAIENTSALLNATIIDNNNSVPALLFTVATVQLGALGGTGAFALPTTSLTVGGNGASTTYSGALTGSGALLKVGAGIFTLAGANNITGATTVSAGVLRITGSLTGTPSMTVASGATLELAPGTLSVAGPITNAGTVRLLGSTALSSTGSFTNNGVLDLINGPASPPANLVNNGVVLDSKSVRAQSVALAGGQVSVTILSYPGHSYQLQRKDGLSAASWQNAGPAQAGVAGAVLTFTDMPAVGSATGFYRVVVMP